jgi:spore coat protein U-like protein
MFFSEEKNQKTFTSAQAYRYRPWLDGWEAAERLKVFCFFFSKKKIFLFLAFLCLAHPARAITCSIAVSNVAFGNVALLGGLAQDSTASATITCSGGAALTTYIFCINIYSGSNVSGTQRNMAGGGVKLPYALYADLLYSVPWGSWTGAYLSGGVQTTATTLLAGTISLPLTVYAQIPAGEAGASVGSYTDTLPGSANQALQYAPYGGAGDTACPLTGSGVSVSQFGFSVSATVTTACNVQNGSLTFSTVSTLSAAIQGTGSLSVACSGAAPYSVGLGLGNYASGSQRRMYSLLANSYVSYNLYTDSGYSDPWSTTTSASSCTNGASTCYLGTGNGAYQTVPVYGTVPAQAGEAAGIYSDTVTATITY